MGKGSTPRPFSVSQDEFGKNFDAIFRRPDPRAVEDAQREDEEFERIGGTSYQCWCYNCLNKIKDGHGLPITMTMLVVCPTCGNKRCPRSTDHNLACTGSNEPGQPGSRYITISDDSLYD